jgi:N-lysine methyltransferase SETD6
MTRLLLQSHVEWQKTQQKSKLPKPLVDADILSVVIDVLQNRLAEYPTTKEVSQCIHQTAST